MRKYFEKMGEKTFTFVAAALCLFGDVMLSKYTYSSFTNVKAFDHSFNNVKPVLDKIFAKQGITLPDDFKQEIFQMLTNMLLTMLAIFILFHIFNYTFFIFRKRFAHLYLNFLSWTGTVGACAMGFSKIAREPAWGSFFFLQMFFFIFVAYGLRVYPVKKK